MPGQYPSLVLLLKSFHEVLFIRRFTSRMLAVWLKVRRSLPASAAHY
jgi:hypothetical protein